MEVVYIDHMGSDIRVVNAARVSFAKESWWEPDVFVDTDGKGHRKPPVYKLSEGDQKLINYLATHNHWTPFSHVQITLREKVPIFVARQRFKHMVGFTYNEVSRRYVDDTPQFYMPEVWRKRAENKKQGSSDERVKLLDWYIGRAQKTGGQFTSVDTTYKEFIRDVERIYTVMIENGVAPEQARMVLPQSMYTEFYSTGSLPAWARMINLRKDSHAQKEIQDLARMCDAEIRNIPELKHSWEALVGEKWY